MAQDSSQADFWDVRYQGQVMPWDAGQVPAALAGFVAAQRVGQRVLVPGCGSGYELAYLAEAGYVVDGIDFSAAALAQAHKVLGAQAALARQADFFALGGAHTYDWVYERAFLCALPRKMWAAYAQTMAALLPSGGLLAGFFFITDTLKGPPFGIACDELAALLSPYFVRLDAYLLDDSLPVFSGHEWWMCWQRR
ncbi:methyltransferase domain-containing protein [Craterilacuibacter sp.]|uniref:methyltransferase domain-containing protein n=1 Tax=Craterilacuibacter sp. TaxID=2870909 RepID=UPI003F3BE7D2